MTQVLAIDPATRFGYAANTADGRIVSGVMSLKDPKKKNEHPGERWARARQHMRCLIVENKPDLVVYERSLNTKSIDSAQIAGGVIAHIQEACHRDGIPCEHVHWATVKKHATGKGNADKDMMLYAAQCEWPKKQITDHNEADALWILMTKLYQLSTQGNSNVPTRRTQQHSRKPNQSQKTLF